MNVKFPHSARRQNKSHPPGPKMILERDAARGPRRLLRGSCGLKMAGRGTVHGTV